MTNIAKSIAKPAGVRLGSKVNQMEPELVAYTTGLTTPLSSGQKTKLNTFIKALKVGLNINALSDAFDVMYVLGGETEESSLRNLVKRAHDATAVNSPAFTALEGFTGNGTSSYIDTKYKGTDGINMTQNSASVGIYSRTNVTNNQSGLGAIDSGDGNGIFLSPKTNGGIYWRINDSVSTQTPVVDSLGLYIINRSGANNTLIRKNKSTLGSTTRASATPVTINLYICCFNNAGSAIAFDVRQYSFFFASKSITTGEMDSITDAIEAYMDSNGKGVIA